MPTQGHERPEFGQCMVDVSVCESVQPFPVTYHKAPSFHAGSTLPAGEGKATTLARMAPPCTHAGTMVPRHKDPGVLKKCSRQCVRPTREQSTHSVVPPLTSRRSSRHLSTDGESRRLWGRRNLSKENLEGEEDEEDLEKGRSGRRRTRPRTALPTTSKQRGGQGKVCTGCAALSPAITPPSSPAGPRHPHRAGRAPATPVFERNHAALRPNSMSSTDHPRQTRHFTEAATPRESLQGHSATFAERFVDRAEVARLGTPFVQTSARSLEAGAAMAPRWPRP